MSAATGFKRLGLAVAVLLGIVFGALGVVSFLVPAAQVREAVTAEIRAATGFEPQIHGDVSVSLFPSGSVTFENVALGAGDIRPLSAAQLTARLRFFPLLTGRIEVSDVTLVRPQIEVTLEPDGASNWSPLIAALTRALGPEATRRDRAMAFSEIRISSGAVTVRNAARQVLERFGNVELSLAWPAISRSFAATGQMVWRGEPLEVSATIADFSAALVGQRSGVKLRLAGTPVKFAFEGTASTRPTVKVEGAVSADSPSLRRALLWAGMKAPPGGGFEPFSLKAQANVVGGTIALTGVNLELDGNAAEGVLTFATDGRQTLQGTLAADTLDATPYIGAVRLLTGNDREWNRMPIALDGLNGFDLDLRLSAARIGLGQARLGRTAVAANLRGGNLTVTVGESQAFGGVIKGSFGLAAAERGADFKSQLQFTNVDLETCIGELFGVRRLEGKGTMSVALSGSGPNVLALTRTLEGSISLTGSKGALNGLNLEQLLRRLERRPLSAGSEFRSGRTPFEKLNVTLKIAQGTATLDSMTFDGPTVRVALAGSASIPGRDLDLKGTAMLVAASATDGRAPFELPFVVQGPWDDPLMLPDPQILIQRSGAAAPLLDAVRDRRAREAVRSAIERLTGVRGGIPPAVGSFEPAAAHDADAAQPADRAVSASPQTDTADTDTPKAE